MEEFKMPHLTMYTFTIKGEVFGKTGRQVDRLVRGGYWLYGDDKKRCFVGQKEIIAYGKHLSHIHVDGIPCGYIKLQSKINNKTFEI